MTCIVVIKTIVSVVALSRCTLARGWRPRGQPAAMLSALSPLDIQTVFRPRTLFLRGPGSLFVTESDPIVPPRADCLAIMECAPVGGDRKYPLPTPRPPLIISLRGRSAVRVFCQPYYSLSTAHKRTHTDSLSLLTHAVLGPDV